MGALRRRISATATALGVGGLAAWPFYHDQADRSAPAIRPSATVPAESAAVVSTQIVAHEQVAARIIATEAVASELVTQSGQSVLPAAQPPLPKLQGQFPSSETQVPSARPIVVNRQSVRTATEEKYLDDQEPIRTYRLRDGDTLGELAERFLGDRTRATELFEANRGILTSEELLPIGKEIRLPPRDRPVGKEPPASDSGKSPRLTPIRWPAATQPRPQT